MFTNWVIKIAIYCPQGSGTLRQRLTILHILHILFILHILYILHILQIESSDCLWFSCSGSESESPVLRTGVIWKSGWWISNRSGWLLELLTELIREMENVAHIHLIFSRVHTSESHKTHLKAFINEKYVILAHKNNFLGHRNVFLFFGWVRRNTSNSVYHWETHKAHNKRGMRCSYPSI